MTVACVANLARSAVVLLFLTQLLATSDACESSLDCPGSQLCQSGVCTDAFTSVMGMSLVLFIFLVILLPIALIIGCITLCVCLSRRRHTVVLRQGAAAAGTPGTITMIHQPQAAYAPFPSPYQPQHYAYHAGSPPAPAPAQQHVGHHAGQPNYGYQHYPEQGQLVHGSAAGASGHNADGTHDNDGSSSTASAPPPYEDASSGPPPVYSKSQGVPQ